MILRQFILMIERQGWEVIQSLPLNVTILERACVQRTSRSTFKALWHQVYSSRLVLRSGCGWPRSAGHRRAPGRCQAVTENIRGTSLAFTDRPASKSMVLPNLHGNK